MKKNIIATIAVLLFCLTLSSFYRAPSQSDKLKESMARGSDIYATTCSACHMQTGEGISGVFPPLAKSDYLMADITRSIRQIIYGADGEMVVNGVTYNGQMAALDLSDEQVSDVLNYVRNSWGNKGEIVTPADVKAARK
ncbi:MAG: cytochrome c [Bacteroidota bacterium]